MKMRFSHLTLADRRRIERWRLMKMSVDEIARRLGRHRSTVFRELRRNHYHDAELTELTGYWGVLAQKLAHGRRFRHRKLIRHPDLRQRVVTCLKAGWSPEQIAGRMRLEAAPIRVSQETIYQFVYSEDGRSAELWRHLASGRRKRRGYRRRKRPPPKFTPELGILFRPDTVAGRREFGHWECDLLHFRQKFGPANVTTLVERLSRFIVVLRNPEKRARPIMAQIAEALRPLPLRARRSVTFDRGSEFVDWPHLQAELGARTWFCDPQSPWQKGSIENANKRLRRWICRDTDPETFTQEDLRRLCAGLNATPRKCLDYRTPAEVFRANVIGHGYRTEKLSRRPKSHLA